MSRNTELADQLEAYIRERIEEHVKKDNTCILTGVEVYHVLSELFNPDCVPVIDTGNWENAAPEELLRILDNVRRHPYLFKLFQL